MNTRYIMKKRGFGLLCLLGIMGLSSCTNESEEQTLGGDLFNGTDSAGESGENTCQF